MTVNNSTPNSGQETTPDERPPNRDQAVVDGHCDAVQANGVFAHLRIESNDVQNVAQEAKAEAKADGLEEMLSPSSNSKKRKAVDEQVSISNEPEKAKLKDNKNLSDEWELIKKSESGTTTHREKLDLNATETTKSTFETLAMGNGEREAEPKTGESNAKVSKVPEKMEIDNSDNLPASVQFDKNDLFSEKAVPGAIESNPFCSQEVKIQPISPDSVRIKEERKNRNPVKIATRETTKVKKQKPKPRAVKERKNAQKQRPKKDKVGTISTNGSSEKNKGPTFQNMERFQPFPTFGKSQQHNEQQKEIENRFRLEAAKFLSKFNVQQSNIPTISDLPENLKMTNFIKKFKNFGNFTDKFSDNLLDKNAKLYKRTNFLKVKRQDATPLLPKIDSMDLGLNKPNGYNFSIERLYDMEMFLLTILAENRRYVKSEEVSKCLAAIILQKTNQLLYRDEHDDQSSAPFARPADPAAQGTQDVERLKNNMKISVSSTTMRNFNEIYSSWNMHKKAKALMELPESEEETDLSVFPEPIAEAEEKFDSDFTCKICKKKLSSKSALNLHSRVHTGEMPHQCNFCNEKFRWYTSFKRHLSVHDEAVHSCPVNNCVKKFLNTKKLNKHLKKYHSGETNPPNSIEKVEKEE